MYDYSFQVARTAGRPLASGALSMFDALVFLATQLSVGCLILLQLNFYSILLGASSLGEFSNKLCEASVMLFIFFYRSFQDTFPTEFKVLSIIGHFKSNEYHLFAETVLYNVTYSKNR